MHIPDNLLSTPVWATLDVAAVPAIALVSRQAQRTTDSNRLPLLGVMGAFVFAAQMINFPVGIGTSGHLVGGTLLACLLGPWAAALVVTAILIVQALVFQDGGVLALGANILNMAVFGVLAGYLPYWGLSRIRWKARGLFVGGFCSVLVSGLLALSELALSGLRMPPGLIWASLALFSVNALMEGAITVSVVRAIERLNPAMKTGANGNGGTGSAWPRAAAAIGVAALTLGSVGILIASTKPDGLEHLTQMLGLAFGGNPVLPAPLSDYQLRAFGTGWLSRATAGLTGLGIVYLVCAAGSYLLGRGRRSYSQF